MVDERSTNNERGWYFELVDVSRAEVDGKEETRVVELHADRWTLHGRTSSPRFRWQLNLILADSREQAEAALVDALDYLGGICYADSLAGGPFATIGEAYAAAEVQCIAEEWISIRIEFLCVLRSRVVSVQGAWFYAFLGEDCRICRARSHAEAAQFLGVNVRALFGYFDTENEARASHAERWLTLTAGTP